MNNNEEKFFVGLRISPTLNSMVERLIEERGYSTRTMVFVSALVAFYQDNFKDYLEAKQSIQLSGSEKAKRAAENSRMRRMSIAEEKKNEEIALCTMPFPQGLGGKVDVSPNGSQVCVYKTFDKWAEFEQKLPLNMLSSELINTQYYPSKEKVEEYRLKGKPAPVEDLPIKKVTKKKK